MVNVVANKLALHNALLRWYAIHGRQSLPWRNLPRDGSCAYHIYVSEIMLQQTQLSRVLESYYFPFLTRFPTLSTLADSSEQEVLRSWQGLGYYSRARNMHQTARICLEHHGAKLPPSLEALHALPGIGEYTAGAIWCFGFGGQTYFADSNIARVLRRLVAQDLSPKALREFASALVSVDACFDYHQALIDLGATICTKSPKCHACPLKQFCKSAHKPVCPPLASTPKSPKAPSTRIPLTLHLALILRESRSLESSKSVDSSQMSAVGLASAWSVAGADSGEIFEIALCYSNKKLYKGLYNLPIILESSALSPESNTASAVGAVEQISNQNSTLANLTHATRLLGSFTHAYTKYAITAHVYMLLMPNTPKNSKQTTQNLAAQILAESSAEFFALDSLPPIANLTKKALTLLENRKI